MWWYLHSCCPFCGGSVSSAEELGRLAICVPEYMIFAICINSDFTIYPHRISCYLDFLQATTLQYKAPGIKQNIPMIFCFTKNATAVINPVFLRGRARAYLLYLTLCI